MNNIFYYYIWTLYKKQKNVTRGIIKVQLNSIFSSISKLIGDDHWTQTWNQRWSSVETQTCWYCSFGKKNLWFYYIFSFYLVYDLDLVLNEVAWNGLEVALFWKILPPQCERVCGGSISYIYCIWTLLWEELAENQVWHIFAIL